MSGQPQLTVEELSLFLKEVFPQIDGFAEVEEVGSMRARVRIRVGEGQLRPGGTVSGPTLFSAADLAFYAAVLCMIGREPLAVTSSLSITFLRKPRPTDLIAEGRILKLGRRLASGDVLIFSEGLAEPVAMAQTTYALPERRDA